MMREMKSNIKTNPQRLVKATAQAFKTARQQEISQAQPGVVVKGVPGDPDYKKGVTGAFKNMMPVHSQVGSSVVGSFAYNTNSKHWRDYNPGFFDGLLPAAGEFSRKPFYFTDMEKAATDPSQIKTAGEDELPTYGEVVPATRSQARPVSTFVVQSTDKW